MTSQFFEGLYMGFNRISKSKSHELERRLDSERAIATFRKPFYPEKITTTSSTQVKCYETPQDSISILKRVADELYKKEALKSYLEENQSKKGGMQVKDVTLELVSESFVSASQKQGTIRFFTPEGLRIRNKLISSHIFLVPYMLKKVRYYHEIVNRGVITYEDLLQEGGIGLMEAVGMFDYSMGFQLSTYAGRAILNGFYSALERSKKIKEYVVGSEDQMEFMFKTIKAKPQRDSFELREELSSALKKLTLKEQTIIHWIYLSDNPHLPKETFQNLSEMFKLSATRVRQIKAEALKKLKKILLKNGELEFE